MVIFDFDGTLVDTLHDIVAAINAARVELGELAASADAVRSWIGEGLDHLIRQALPAHDTNDEAHARLKRRYGEHYAGLMYATSAPYPGAMTMLDALAGGQLAVCSNKSEDSVQAMLRHFDMHQRFFGIIGGDTLHVRKPDPAVIHHLVARARGPVGEVWMVGDSAVDVRTGKAAGARTIACAYGIRGRDELEREKPDFIVDDVAAIANIILPR